MLLLPNNSLVLRAFSTLANAAPGKTNYDYHLSYVKDFGSTGYVSALNQIFANVTDTDLATLTLNNLGLNSVFSVATAKAYIAGNAGNRVGAVLNLADALSNYAGTDANLLSAKAAYNNKLDYSFNYSTVASNLLPSNFPDSIDLTTFNLTTAIDKLVGTSGNDLFKATILDNQNTLQSGDVITGGLGVDTLFADIGTSQNFAITAETVGVENITIRAEANGSDSKDNNIVAQVEIDAQRMNSVQTWTDSNSRADLIIEDVRIADGAKTKDVTIVMESTDPGHVDYAVYFDQHSLRNTSTGNTTITVRLMDTGAAGAAATAATPLLNNPYDLFKLAINGNLTDIQLDKAAVKAADTYEALLTVFQNALAGTGIAVSLGANFSVTDPLSNTTVTGKEIILTGGAGASITTPTGSGWFNTTGASVPANSNIYTTYTTGSMTQTELVTSTIVLDDVGRGSTGGDLVVGGLSTGLTSTSRGVERFEIEVRDNSKLEHITSTNGALREVTIKNGKTTNTDQNQGAYDKTATDAGNLTVNGNALGGTPDTKQTGVLDSENGNYGFTDVRLIDGSAMTGKLAFTAQITNAAIAKYINLTDTAASATADVAGAGNVNYGVLGANFDYRGGANNDTIVVKIDEATVASRSSIVSGQSDFTFTVDGGAGSDAITVDIASTRGAVGGGEHWYDNQKLNNNITINAGTGDDVVRTPGAGDANINLGAGNDVAYTDNTGKQALTITALAGTDVQAQVSSLTGKAVWVANTTGTAAGVAITNLQTDSVETYNIYKAQLQVSFKGLDSAKITLANTTTYKTTDWEINQAIKNAVNNDAVLKNLLVVKDGPGASLVFESLIDGVMVAGETPTVTLTAPAAADLTSTELSAIAAAWGVTTPAAATAADLAAYAFNGTVGASLGGAVGGSAVSDFNTNADYTLAFAKDDAAANITGADSTATSDNGITVGAGNDLVVLGTDVTGASALLTSNDRVVFDGTFDKDVVVNFTAGALTAGGDQLDLSAYKGTATAAWTIQGVAAGAAISTSAVLANAAAAADAGVTANNLIVVRNLDTTGTAGAADRNDSAASVKLQYTEGVVANKGLYITVDAGNVATVYQVVDGTAANDLAVTLVGSIDLADTAFTTLLQGTNII